MLLDENENLKVSDFGLSALAESKHQDGLLHTTCGTPAYVASYLKLLLGIEKSNGDTLDFHEILKQEMRLKIKDTVWASQDEEQQLEKQGHHQED